ncbi:MAG TPA: hypothetical protein VN688_29805 [Gemmataceae bacterium]|nr:hypothetical protein [Gemmataceae bacterium]
MLFSQDRVANFINQSFEATWESVRPVPIVRIDFGNGNVLTRTLHGNILTSICTPNGFVVDALPGIYTAPEYLTQLGVLGAVAKNAQTARADRRDYLVRAYHRGQAQALKKNAKPGQAAANRARLAITKSLIERPVELALLPILPVVVPQPQAKPETKPALTAAEDVAQWKELEEDTRLNERTRRLQIHELLAGTGLVQPEKVMRPIYKDVLHADLDDPYLGLGKTLFATYPFAKEDAVH